eukprot:2790946-Pyramimonas_sp.AAC.1
MPLRRSPLQGRVHLLRCVLEVPVYYHKIALGVLDEVLTNAHLLVVALSAEVVRVAAILLRASPIPSGTELPS